MLMLIASCTFGSVVLFVLGLTMRSERTIVRERMQRYARAGDAQVDSVELEMAMPFKERVASPFLRRLAGLAGRLTPHGAIQSIEENLETAGTPWRISATEFMGLRVLALGAFVVLGVTAAAFFDMRPLYKLSLVLLVLAGAILPDYLLQRAIGKRQSTIRRTLPDTLDLLTVSVESGLGLDGAMQKVVEKLKGPLSDEMTRALREMQIGKLRTEALRNLAKRVRVQELTTFVAAVCQAEQLGVSIAQVLRVQSDALRTARSQRAREAASKLPVKMLFPLVFFIFPALFVVVLAPGAIQTARSLGVIK